MSKKWKRNAAKVRGIYHVWVNIAHWADPHDDEAAHIHARNGNYAPEIWQQEAEIFELRLAVEDKIRQKNLPRLTEVKYE